MAHKEAKIRVGVVQMFFRKSLAENRDRIIELIAQAKAEDCDVAVFPESILSDSNGGASPEDFERAIEAIKNRAKTCDINVVIGVSTAAIAANHNCALVVDRTGRELLRYQKNTEMPQRIWLDGVPCAIAICSDRWYIEHADLACLTQGAKVMIDISGGHGGDDGRPDLRWIRYRCWALRNSAFVAMVNPPHDDAPDYMGNAVWGGHSAIFDPNGAFLAKAHYEKDVIRTATLDLDLATRKNAEHRRNHPLFKSWWDLGRSALEGRELEAADFAPIESPEAETRIAVAQIASSQNVDANAAQIIDALQTAAQNGADVVVFPERVVAGSADSGDENCVANALEKIRNSAKKNAVYAIVGAPLTEKGRRFNSAIVIDRSGEIATRYDQISACSDGPFTPGNSTQAMWFNIDGVLATVTVGADLYFPELTELSAYRGMQLHFHLDNWRGASDDADLVRKHSAINFLAPAVCGIWANASGPNASGRSLLLRRTGGHGKPNPGGIEAYLPYQSSVVETGGTEPQILYLTASTTSQNTWQAWRNKTRKNARRPWYDWIGHGVRAVHI